MAINDLDSDLDLKLLDQDSESCSFSGLGIEASGLGLGLDLVVAGLDISLLLANPRICRTDKNPDHKVVVRFRVFPTGPYAEQEAQLMLTTGSTRL